MLSLNAFESGMLFEQQLIEDESLLRYQACADFWRRHCYPLPRDIAQVVFDVWKGPKALLKDIDRYLQGEAPVIKARHRRRRRWHRVMNRSWRASTR